MREVAAVKMKEVQRMAKGLGINCWGMKKVDLIRTIQEREGNVPCFFTERVQLCGETQCLWYESCKTFPDGKP